MPNYPRLLLSTVFCTWSFLPVLAQKNASVADEVRRPVPSKRSGMGAIPSADGTLFRVWAPNARRVFVGGDFNAWKTLEMAPEKHGHYSLDVPEAKPGQAYKFAIETEDGDRLWKNDPRALQVQNSAGSSLIYDHQAYPWKSRNFRTPAFHDMVIYEMHIGSFHDEPGGKPGTWKSAMAKLDHLQALGVSMLQVLPPAEFPGDFSWGYNPSYPFAPESSYGRPDDMKAFIDAAHSRGIGVVMDIVHNHYGPKDLPTWCFDGPCYGNGGIYFYDDHRAETPWGNTRPDYGRHEVRAFIKDSALHWLKDYRLDGLRFDGTKYVRTVQGSHESIPDGWGLLRWINDEVKRKQAWKIMIAEDFGGGDAMTRPTSEGGAGYDTQWAGEFVHPVREALVAPSDASRNMGAVAYAIGQRFNGRATQRVIYTESHDEVANGKSRLPESIWPQNADSWASRKRSTLGAALMLTSPGIPMLFQGQEFLEDGWFDDKDPLDWTKAKRFSGITHLYRDLIRLRRNWYNTSRGLKGEHVNIFHVNHNDKVIAYHRWDLGGPGDDVIIVANFSGQRFFDYDLGLPRGGLWKLRMNSDWKGYASDFGNAAVFDTEAYPGERDGLPFNGRIQELAPYAFAIFSQ